MINSVYEYVQDHFNLFTEYVDSHYWYIIIGMSMFILFSKKKYLRLVKYFLKI